MTIRRLAATTILVTVLVPAIALAADNLLTNGDFEKAKSDSDEGVGAAPVAWSKGTLSAGKTRNASDSKSVLKKVAGARTGKYAAALALDQGDAWVFAQQRIELARPLALYDGIVFSLSAKSSKPADFDLYIEAWNTKTNKGASNRVRMKAGNEWQTFEARLPVTKDAEGLASFRVVVQLYTPGAELLIDDARVALVSGAPKRRAATRFRPGAGAFPAGGEDLLHVDLECPALRMTGSPITVQAWFKTTARRGIIFECGAQNRDPGPQAGYALYLKWGKLRFGVNNAVEMYKDALWDDVTTNATYNDGAWHHATGVFAADGKTRVKLYVDGIEATGVKRAGQVQGALSAYTPTTPAARIGGRTDRIEYPELAACFWNGELADVRVWDKALSPEEIEANWARPVPADTPGLVACWTFREKARSPGDVVRDQAGNNDGVAASFEYAPAIDEPFFPVDRNVFPKDDFDYAKYPSNITGYNGQNLQRVGFVTWQPAHRTRVGPRGAYKAGLAQLPDGRLVLAVCRRHPEYDEEADKRYWQILMFASDDQGGTWTEIGRTPLVGKEPALAALPDGALVLTAQNMDYRKSAADRRMNAYRSIDGGRTWREMAIDEGESRYPYPRNIIVDKDGSLLYLRARGDDIETCRSADAGDTWTFTPGKVNWEAKDIAHTLFAEVGVLRMRDGRLLATLRREIPKTSGEGFEDTFLTRSTDDGQTWSRPWRASGTAEVHGYLTELADGRLLLSYASYHLPYGAAAVTSGDGGKTWNRERPLQLAVSATCYAGWPFTLELADGSLITSYATTIYTKKDPPTTACEVVRWRLP